MGPVYIPLIPLAAIGICLLLQRLAYSLSHQKDIGKVFLRSVHFYWAFCHLSLP